eukprot:Pgem_evm3s18256
MSSSQNIIEWPAELCKDVPTALKTILTVEKVDAECDSTEFLLTVAEFINTNFAFSVPIVYLMWLFRNPENFTYYLYNLRTKHIIGVVVSIRHEVLEQCLQPLYEGTFFVMDHKYQKKGLGSILFYKLFEYTINQGIFNCLVLSKKSHPFYNEVKGKLVNYNMYIQNSWELSDFVRREYIGNHEQRQKFFKGNKVLREYGKSRHIKELMSRYEFIVNEQVQEKHDLVQKLVNTFHQKLKQNSNSRVGSLTVKNPHDWDESQKDFHHQFALYDKNYNQIVAYIKIFFMEYKDNFDQKLAKVDFLFEKMKVAKVRYFICLNNKDLSTNRHLLFMMLKHMNRSSHPVQLITTTNPVLATQTASAYFHKSNYYNMYLVNNRDYPEIKMSAYNLSET